MNKKIFIAVFIVIFPANLAFAQFSDSDLNQDGIVNNYDLYQLINFWLNDCYEQPCYNIDIKEDGIIDFLDFAGVAENWKVNNSNSYQVAYWPLNETSGTLVNDITLNEHNGQMQNMTPSDHIVGNRGYALDFDGSNDYVLIDTLSNGMGQHFTRDFSIAVWVYQYTPIPVYQTIIGIESTSRFEGYGFEGFTIEVDNGEPNMYIAYADALREKVMASFAFTPNTWQHLCVVREGSSLRFYLNGKLTDNRIITSSNIKFGSAWPGYDTIGVTYDSYFGRNAYFKGRLDEIHLYNFAIPESLVRKLAQQDYAWLPKPEDSSANIPVDTNLNWQKGVFAASENGHDVYFGTDYNQVFIATTGTTGIYQGRQTSRLFEPDELAAETFYYWRVDDVNGTQTHKGSVWSFKAADSFASIEASTSQSGYGATGAYDGHRFEATTGACWKGMPIQFGWYWQINFTQPRQIGAVLIIMGEPGTADTEFEGYLNNAPSNYIWQYSNDGSTWYDIPETYIQNEKRLFRIQRFNQTVTAEHLRLQINGKIGSYPTIREIELYSQTNTTIPFDDWLIAVDITNEPGAPYGNTSYFINRARQCSGWDNVQGQQIWVNDFNEAFLNIEPYPLCVFVSGSFDEWCQATRSYFVGLQEVLVNGNIPMWGSCGGGQVLGLLIDPGCENPWDCPRCRYYHSPAWSPIYGHIGYINPAIEPQACGDYSNNIYEIGDYLISQVIADPVFTGLSNPFYAYEYHCGQITYLPPGWIRIGGQGDSNTLTYYQCFRRSDRYIYGAQFHIENNSSYSVTNANARVIMSNFLYLAQQWGGYNPP